MAKRQSQVYNQTNRSQVTDSCTFESIPLRPTRVLSRSFLNFEDQRPIFLSKPFLLERTSESWRLRFLICQSDPSSLLQSSNPLLCAKITGDFCPYFLPYCFLIFSSLSASLYQNDFLFCWCFCLLSVVKIHALIWDARLMISFPFVCNKIPSLSGF